MSWAISGSAAASVVAGAASGAINKATAKGGEAGYDMPTMDPSPYDARNQQLMAQMSQQNAINSQAGRLSPGMQILLDQIKKRQLAESKRTMYGDPGDRGGSIMNNTMAMGSMGGVGPKAMMAQGSKAMNDYASRNSQIMNYIDSLEYSGLQGAGDKAFNQMNSMPRSSEIPWTGATPGHYQPGQEGYDTGLGDVDWYDAFSSNSGGEEPPTPPANAPGPQLRSQYGSISPYVGGGYVMGNQQGPTQKALPALSTAQTLNNYQGTNNYYKQKYGI
jgi:hypothetical protein